LGGDGEALAKEEEGGRKPGLKGAGEDAGREELAFFLPRAGLDVLGSPLKI
jgi:hypothetical protein